MINMILYPGHERNLLLLEFNLGSYQGMMLNLDLFDLKSPTYHLVLVRFEILHLIINLTHIFILHL